MEETQLLAPSDNLMDERASLPSFSEYFQSEGGEEVNKTVPSIKNEDLNAPAAAQSSSLPTRHSTSIYQMLERIENKVNMKALERDYKNHFYLFR